jgi:peroxiredoxin
MQSQVRKRRWLGQVVVAAVLVAARGTWAAPAATSMAATPKVGEKAPAFELTALDGSRVTLAGEVDHGPVVLVLLRGWPGYQCPFCTRQFADFLDHAKEIEGIGARVVWVYPGPADQVEQRAREFTAARAMPGNFRVTTDPDYKFTVAYGLRWEAPNETAYPATFVIDRTSIVRFAQISAGHDGRAQAVDVLKALATLPR